MCNLSNSAINNFTLALPSDVSHSRPSTRDEKERADIPWAVYRGLMRSQMRIGSPLTAHTEAARLFHYKPNTHNLGYCQRSLTESRLWAAAVAVIPAAAKSQRNVLSVGVLVDFFEIQYMQPWVFTYSCTSFKCASHENESSGSGLQSQIKVPPQKKKEKTKESVELHRAWEKMSTLILTLEVEAAEKLVEEMNASYDLCTDEVWKTSADDSRAYRAQRKIAFWSIFSRTYIDIKARVRFRLHQCYRSEF